MIFEKINIQKQNFWFYQILGWAVYAILFYFFFYWKNIQRIEDALGFSVTIISGFLFSTIMYYLLKKANLFDRPILLLTVMILFISIFMANLWFWFDTFLSMFIYGIKEVTAYLSEKSFLFYLSSGFYYAILFISWSGLYLFIKFWHKWQIQREKTEQADKLAQNVQLQMLRYQLNPHFLFNSLNSIRALIDEDGTNAKSMVTELSDFLRLESKYNDTSEDTRKLEYGDQMFLNIDNQMIFLKIKTILCIVAAGDYSEIITSNGHRGLVRKTMKEWENRLPTKYFTRIHRSTIINLEYIDQIEEWSNYSYRIYIKGIKTPFIMSRRYVSKIKQLLS